MTIYNTYSLVSNKNDKSSTVARIVLEDDLDYLAWIIDSDSLPVDRITVSVDTDAEGAPSVNTVVNALNVAKTIVMSYTNDSGNLEWVESDPIENYIQEFLE